MWVEKIFEEKMRESINVIYFETFPNLVNIERYERNTEINGKNQFLDIELGIDTILTFENGSILTFQEKVRKNKYLGYDDFTFEYYNDPYTKEVGEWFKLVSQLYFYGFVNKGETDFVKYYILNIPLFRIFLNTKSEYWIEQHTKQNHPPERNNFIWIPFRLIPKNCFIKIN